MDIKEKYKNARAFVVLLAALIAWVLSLKYKKSLIDALITELIVIVIFIIVSTIAIKLIDKIRNMESKNVVSIENKDESPETDEKDENIEE